MPTGVRISWRFGSLVGTLPVSSVLRDTELADANLFGCNRGSPGGESNSNRHMPEAARLKAGHNTYCPVCLCDG